MVDHLRRLATDLLVLARELERLDSVLGGAEQARDQPVEDADPTTRLLRTLQRGTGRGDLAGVLSQFLHR